MAITRQEWAPTGSDTSNHTRSLLHPVALRRVTRYSRERTAHDVGVVHWPANTYSIVPRT